tara:strand:- start:3533 stop:5896 length:2364 start_codon:yes stop_codon:yes gene_type:complete
MTNPMQLVGSKLELKFDKVLATSAVEYNDKWRTDVSLFVEYDCDSVPTDTLNSILARIDTLISDSFFYSTSARSMYDLDTCRACPEGYRKSEDYSHCVLRDTINATFNGSFKPVVKGDSIFESYIRRGARIYDTFNKFETPLTLEGSSLEDDQGSVVTVNQSMDLFWKREMLFFPYNVDPNHRGRLNDVGIWTNGEYKGKWIGFSKCINAPTAKEYFIGFAADNRLRVSINGTQIVNFNSGNGYHFKYWHIVPVQLEKGINYIELEGYNDEDEKAFGAEIYNTTEAELASFTSEAQLDSVILFSTKERIGSDFDLGENTGYSCPAGYALDLCGSSAICVSRDTAQIKICDDCPEYITWDGLALKNVLEVLDVSPINIFTADIRAKVLNENDQIDTISLELFTPCDTLFECQKICKFESRPRIVNPFLTGLRGNWRPNKSWTYVADRAYEGSRATPETDGFFAGVYTPFWEWSSNDLAKNTSNPAWVWTSEVTEYSPFGMELENKDPLGRYSSALYGYAKTLPVAVASNTRYRELWYEGFEEYTYLGSIADNYICPPWQYPYSDDPASIYLYADNGNLDETHSHSGNVSLKLDFGDSLLQEIALNPSFVDDAARGSFSSLKYFTKEEDQIIPFRPDAGEYVLSAWVSEIGNPNDTLFETTYITVEMEDDMGTITTSTFLPKGLIIEGWQRIEEILTIPENTEIMRIIYKSDASVGWFDDFRIFPYHGSMKSYAYDFRTLRLMAELDENNYATFYEYDLEGNLVRIKKETERGIKSLQESRQHQKSTNQ